MSIGKKEVVIIVACFLMAVVATWAVSTTWTSVTVSMKANSSDSIQLMIFADCAATTRIEAIDWAGITQGNVYEKAVFVHNNGTRGLYVTYLPTKLSFDDNQSYFEIRVWVWEQGLPCQLFRTDPPVQLAEKDPMNPNLGFWLEPGKMIKLLTELHVFSVVAGRTYNWNFTVYGSTGESAI